MCICVLMNMEGRVDLGCLSPSLYCLDKHRFPPLNLEISDSHDSLVHVTSLLRDHLSICPESWDDNKCTTRTGIYLGSWDLKSPFHCFMVTAFLPKPYLQPKNEIKRGNL